MRKFSRRGRAGQINYEVEAYSAIQDLLDRHLAVVRPEIEARLAEPSDPGSPDGINPHHLTNALRRLRSDHRIEAIMKPTRGGRVITVYVPSHQTGRRIAIEEAAARKRLLQTRYVGWAEGSSRGPNVIGAGGELVARASLSSANQSTSNYRILNPSGREVETLFGAKVAGGALDLVAQFILEGEELETVVTVTMEVKNLRSWIYPRAHELFQLLDKAARLQVAHPRRRFMPLLICRRAQYLTFCMAKHLGFFVLIFDRRAASQPIQPHWTVNLDHLREVREKLGYVLALTDAAMPHLTRQFERTVPNQALATAERWAEMAPSLLPYTDSMELKGSKHWTIFTSPPRPSTAPPSLGARLDNAGLPFQRRSRYIEHREAILSLAIHMRKPSHVRGRRVVLGPIAQKSRPWGFCEDPSDRTNQVACVSCGVSGDNEVAKEAVLLSVADCLKIGHRDMPSSMMHSACRISPR